MVLNVVFPVYIISIFVSLEVRKVLQILNYSTNSSYVRASVQACVRTCVCVWLSHYHPLLVCEYTQQALFISSQTKATTSKILLNGTLSSSIGLTLVEDGLV